MKRRLASAGTTILDFMRNFVDRNGYAPACWEISLGTGMAVSTVHWYLKRLEADGLVERRQWIRGYYPK